MAGIPDRIVLRRHLELAGPGFNRPIRYALVGLFGLVLVLGLANVFGQRPETRSADSAKASLELYVPDRLRGGLIYEARFTIEAHRKVAHAVVVLSPGWPEGQTFNTVTPGPVAETSKDGSLALTLGEIPKGEKFTFYMQLQTNPTNVGRRHADVYLYDGNERLLSIERTVTVFP